MDLKNMMQRSPWRADSSGGDRRLPSIERPVDNGAAKLSFGTLAPPVRLATCKHNYYYATVSMMLLLCNGDNATDR